MAAAWGEVGLGARIPGERTMRPFVGVLCDPRGPAPLTASLEGNPIVNAETVEVSLCLMGASSYPILPRFELVGCIVIMRLLLAVRRSACHVGLVR